MRILHVISSFDIRNGGTYSAIQSIVRIETGLGYRNEILSIAEDGQESDVNEPVEKLMLFPRSFPFRFGSSRKAFAWLKLNVHNYDLIILHEVWSYIAIRSAFICKKADVRYIIWPHGSLDPFDLKKKKHLKKLIGPSLIKKVTARAHAICCTSTLEKDVLRTYNKKRLNIQVLPLPVDNSETGSRSRFREEFCLKENEFVFLFLSRIDYKKGLDVFLISLKRFLDKTSHANIKFIVAGRGSLRYETYINELIDELHLKDHVVLSGFLSGRCKADAFAGSDCFVLPSMNENYGISMIEALQANLPVLISDNVYIHQDIMPEAGWVCKYDEASVLRSIELIYDQFNGRCFEKEPMSVGNRFKLENLLKRYQSFYEAIGK